jgi:hypothetical protein
MAEPEPHPSPQPEEPESDRDRWVTNLTLLAIVAALIGGGIWMANAMYDVRKIQDCAMQGRRNCAPIEVPAR